MIKKIRDILDILNIEYSFYERNPKKEKRSINWTIDIRTARRIKKLIDIFIPHLITKQPNAKILLEFSNIRLSLPYGHPYTERELFLFKEIHKYNLKKGPKRILNDYTPSKRPRYRLKI